MATNKRDFLVLDEYPYELKSGDEITLREDIKIPRDAGCPSGYSQSSMTISTREGRTIGNNWRNEERILFLGTNSDAWPAIMHVVQELTVFKPELIESTESARRFRLVAKEPFELYPGYTIKHKMFFRTGDLVKLVLGGVVPGFHLTLMSMLRHDLHPRDAALTIGMHGEQELAFPSLGIHAWAEIMHLFGALTGLRYKGERSYESRDSVFIYTLERA